MLHVVAITCLLMVSPLSHQIKELRELKIRNLQRNQDRDAEEKSLLQNLHQLQVQICQVSLL